MTLSREEVVVYLARHGCFCGGEGKFTDRNCGESYEATCPHCCGSGVRRCECTQPTLRCPEAQR